MSHVANASRELSFAAIGELQDETMGDNSLLRMLDNAGQTVVVRFGDATDRLVDARLEDIATRGGWKFSKEAAKEAMHNLYRYHANVTMLSDPTAAHESNVQGLPKKDFHRFYSLIYHLTPDGPTYESSRAAIIQTFDKLELEPPLALGKLVKELPAIIALGDPRKLDGRSHG